jgi:mRNA interferase HigB
MQVLGRDKLVQFSARHGAAKAYLDAWFSEVSSKSCIWHTPHDIKQRYASASFLADNRVIFNIKGNNYRLVVKVRYQNGLVVIEWVGTHAEYDKKSF